MARVQGTSTLIGGTGPRSINIGMLATWADIIVGERQSGETIEHLSLGSIVGTNQKVRSICSDGNDSRTFNDNGKVIRHYEKIGGVWTCVFEASFVSFSGTTINLDVTISINNACDYYQTLIKAGNT